MPRTQIRDAVAQYLSSAIASDQIPFLSKVWQHPPKFADESDFYTAQLPGTDSGAMIFVYIGPTSESRTALGGTHSGLKFRPYAFALMCYFRSTKQDAETADSDNDLFIDGLTGWIEADRNLGTAPGTTGYVPSNTVGPNPTGAIFQAGEGDEHGGPDIRVHALLPRLDAQWGTPTIFTSVELTVCEFLIT